MTGPAYIRKTSRAYTKQVGPVFYCRICKVTLHRDVSWSPHFAKSKDYRCRQCAAAYDYIKSAKFTKRYSDLHVAARRFGQETNITAEQHKALLAQPCRYCGFPLNPSGHGLDKKVPKAGYTLDNVVPCCRMCNIIKRDHLTYEEMLVVGASVRQVRLAR